MWRECDVSIKVKQVRLPVRWKMKVCSPHANAAKAGHNGRRTNGKKRLAHMDYGET